MNSESRMVLGTTQFGMPYGIANETGQPGPGDVKTIVALAWESGIRQFDTAQAYGTSEYILGQTLHDIGLTTQAKIITKLDPRLDYSNRNALRKAVDNSLRILRVSSLHCLMLHAEKHLDILDNGLSDILIDIVRDGQCRYIGVSVYSPENALLAIESDIIDCIQVPTNILDKRFENAGVFAMAEEKKKIVYVRSIFLQGLITMDVARIPETLRSVRPVLQGIENIAREYGMTRQEIALNYVKLKFPHAMIIFGVERTEQVRQNIAAWSMNPPHSFLSRLNALTLPTEERVLNPSLWPS